MKLIFFSKELNCFHAIKFYCVKNMMSFSEPRARNSWIWSIKHTDAWLWLCYIGIFCKICPQFCEKLRIGEWCVSMKCTRLKNLHLLFTWGQLWPSDIVDACVCVSTPKLVCVITPHPFKLEPTNLDKRYKTPWLRSLLFWGSIDLDFQGQISDKSPNFTMFVMSTRVNTQLPE